MSGKQFLLLLILAAIWGASFLLMRIVVDVFSPVYLIEARVVFSGLSLAVIALLLKRKLVIRAHIKHYFIVGLFNSAIPWVLFAYAAQTLTVAMLAILNATAPIWGSLIDRVWHGTQISIRGWLGLVLGVFGVIVMVGLDNALFNNESLLAIAAATLAAGCYGLATNYAKGIKQKVSAFNTSHGSMWATALLLLPLLPFFPMKGVPSLESWLAVALLGIVCTGIALIFYFDLVEKLGAAPALSVTFLIPAFAALWGYLVLDERLSLNVWIGIFTVLCGTVLVTGFSFRSLLTKRNGALQQ